MPPKPKLSRDCAKEVQRAVAFSLMEEVYNSKGMTNIKKNKSLVIPACWVTSSRTEDLAAMIHSHVVGTGSMSHFESLVLMVKSSRTLLKHNMSSIC
jgi:hypothetical protein